MRHLSPEPEVKTVVDLDRWRRRVKRGDKIVGVRLYKDPPRVESLDLTVVSPGRKNCVVKLHGRNVTLPWDDLYPFGTDVSSKYRVVTPIEKTTRTTQRAEAPMVVHTRKTPKEPKEGADVNTKSDDKNNEELKRWRKTLRRGDLVEVRDAKWPRPRTGKILNVSARGCGVNCAGHDVFGYWNDIYPPAEGTEAIPEPPVQPKGPTLGDALKTKGVDLRALPPPTPKPVPVVQLVKPEPAKASDVVDTTKLNADQIAQVEASLKKPMLAGNEPFQRRDLGRRTAHNLTAIANMLRTERIRRGRTQKQASEDLGVHYSALSKMELGVESPSDETLLAYVDHWNMDLNALLTARDGQIENAVEAPVLALVPTPKIAIDANDQLDWFIGALDFTERLKAAIPFPSDVEKRRAWYTAALAMYEAQK